MHINILKAPADTFPFCKFLILVDMPGFLFLSILHKIVQSGGIHPLTAY